MTECLCALCTKVVTAPNLPALFPCPDKTENWSLDCNWLSPLVNGKAVYIKRGFITDGASIPRIAWRVIGHPFSKDLLPHALPHDGLYAAELFPTHAECDAWMQASMALAADNYPLSVSWLKRNAVWSAVRTCGGLVWRKHTAQTVYKARQYCKLVGPEEYAQLRDGEACENAVDS